MLATHLDGADPLRGGTAAAAADPQQLLHDEPSSLASLSPATDNDDDDNDDGLFEDAAEGGASMTPLDAALEKIGMGRYQYQLLVLCGLGWAMDNMTLQTVSVILPRVQEHFQVGDRYIGLLSTSIFAGMMVSRASFLPLRENPDQPGANVFFSFFFFSAFRLGLQIGAWGWGSCELR